MGRIIIAYAALFAIAGCASINPYVHGDVDLYYNKDAKTDRPKAKSLDAATLFAEDVRREYRKASGENVLANRALSSLVLASGAGGAFFAITGANIDLLTGLAVAGSTGAVAGGALNQSVLNRVYAEGTVGVNCVMQAFAPLRAVSSTEFQEKLDAAYKRRSELEALLREAPAEIQGLEEIRYADELLLLGKEVQARGEAAMGVLNSAGVRLYESVQTVQSQVDVAIGKQAFVDLAELRVGLAAASPKSATDIAGAAFVPPDEGPRPQNRVLGDALKALNNIRG